MTFIRNVIALFVVALFTANLTQAQKSVPVMDDLGVHSYSITTSSPQAQTYFNQGLRLYYAFNHEEAIRSFDAALEADPDCAMCYWGIALSLGPNINLPMDPLAGARAHKAVQEAVSLADDVTPKERRLIESLVVRYDANPEADRGPLDQAYADAMAELVRLYPDDLEIATLYAESLMDLNPWDYWNEDGTPRASTKVLLAQLERVLEENPHHPGANHFYIHAVEAVDPYRAVDAAERLAELMPGAGHIVHMPGHIYVRVGRYKDAIQANEHAVHADETYIQDQNPEVGVYVAGYYPHNYDFMAFAASMIGKKEQAIEAAEKLRALVPTEMMSEPGMTFLQNHHARHLQFKVRFSDWAAILSEEFPEDAPPHEKGIWHYARGRAFSALNNLGEARKEAAALAEIAADPALADLRLEFNTSQRVLRIASNVLEGYLAAADGDYSDAIERMQTAVALEDGMVYGEPPEWTVPVRHDLGSVLLEAGRLARAEEVFREDLDRFPDNPWALHGLASALEAQGQKREASKLQKRADDKWEGSSPIASLGN